MTDPDRLLDALWAADEPPAQDTGFVLAVVEHIERRRLWADLAGLLGAAVAASAVLWALAPLIEVAVREFVPPANDPRALALTGVGVMAVWLWAMVTGKAGPFQA